MIKYNPRENLDFLALMEKPVDRKRRRPQANLMNPLHQRAPHHRKNQQPPNKYNYGTI